MAMVDQNVRVRGRFYIQPRVQYTVGEIKLKGRVRNNFKEEMERIRLQDQLCVILTKYEDFTCY